ncbi:MAG: hypothetical protein WCC95_08515 [Candidatus Sulfotelmatobacter sp.]|jgi:hypothetical protein
MPTAQEKHDGEREVPQTFRLDVPLHNLLTGSPARQGQRFFLETAAKSFLNPYFRSAPICRLKTTIMRRIWLSPLRGNGNGLPAMFTGQ